MPYTINGVGTHWCGNGSPVNWGSGAFSGTADHDAVECVVFAFLPLIPYKPVHTFNWNGDECRVVPIKWSLMLLIRAWLRPYILVAVWAIPIVLAILLFNDAFEAEPFAVASAIWAVAFGLWFLMLLADRRPRDIRLILGQHNLGSSDPSTWESGTLAEFIGAVEQQGMRIEEMAAREDLLAGRLVDAMWTARLAAGRGEPWGERLTDAVLTDSRVVRVLPELRSRPWERDQILGLSTADAEPT